MNAFLASWWAVEPTAFAQWRELFAAQVAELLAHARSDTATELPAAQANVRQAQEEGLPVRLQGPVAVVSIRGMMVKSAPGWALRSGFAAGSRQVGAAVMAALADRRARSILLMIDSPGGSVDGLAELTDLIFAARQVKPVVAFADGMAASAAFRVASQASRLTLGREAMVGSLGIILTMMDASRMAEREGIEVVQIRTGPFKGAGQFGTEITEAQRADFQRIVDGFFTSMQADLLRGRPQLQAHLAAVSDGRVFVGAEAVGLNLADGVGTPGEALAFAAQAVAGDDSLARARATVMRQRAAAGAQ